MEGVNKMFSGVVIAFETFESTNQEDEIQGCAIKVVNGLTDILKNLIRPFMPGSKIVNRVCEFIDEINGKDKKGEFWEISIFENCDDVLISFSKELARKNLISQIDKIFRCGPFECPLINQLSKYYETKEKSNKLFSMLPKEYQDKLLGEIISYQDGDKDYAYPLIGGSGLMGF